MIELPDTVELVSLLRRPTRRKRALARLHALGFEVRVHDAVDMRPGWRGCRESHMKLWSQAVEEDRTILVMEDDVTFVPNFRAHLDRVLAETPEDFDVLFLGGYERARVGPVSDTVARSRSVMWTHAYVATPAALEYSLRMVRNKDTHIDRVWSSYMGALKVYRAVPWLVGQEDGWSDTGDARAVGRDVVPMQPPKEA